MGRAGAMIGGGARSPGPGVSHGTTPGEVALFRCFRLPSPNIQIPLSKPEAKGKEENRTKRQGSRAHGPAIRGGAGR